jgi:hypothetical protein
MWNTGRSSVAEYRLLTYREGGRSTPGVLVGDRVHPVARLIDAAEIDASSVLSLLESWDATHRALVRAVDRGIAGAGLPLAEAALQAPILRRAVEAFLPDPVIAATSPAA